MSTPEREITKMAHDVQRRMSVASRLLWVLLAVMVVVVAGVADRMAKGITAPILELAEGARRVGGGELEHRLAIATGDELESLAGCFNDMASNLKTYIANLRETTAEKERIESELQVARDIQMSLLKRSFPTSSDRKDFSLYASLEPAREVGGDMYDYALLDGNRLAFYVGDVSDKGVPAALVMAMTVSLMRRACRQPGISPADILREVNVALAEENENCMFVTLFVGVLDLHTGVLTYSNAGHNPPVLVDAGGRCEFLTLPEGLVLGVMPESDYSSESIQLGSSDMIVVYTDGVTEAMNPQRVTYSEERLRETLGGMTGRNVEETVAGVMRSVRAYAAGAPQSDDIAVLAVRRT